MTDKSFRYDWYPKEAHTDFMELTAEEIGVLMQICNLMYIKSAPIENDPKWIARSIDEMGIAKCRNVIKSLEKKGHISIIIDDENNEKISKKMVNNQIEIVNNRRTNSPKNSEKIPKNSGDNSEKIPKFSEKTGQISEFYEPSIEQNQQDTKTLETVEETVPVPVPVISKVLEEIPSINVDVFAAFITHRKSIGKAVHPNFIPNIIDDLKKLTNQGEDPNLVINQSITNGWSSLQPISKGKNNAQRKSRKQDLAEQAAKLLDKFADPEPNSSDDCVL